MDPPHQTHDTETAYQRSKTADGSSELFGRSHLLVFRMRNRKELDAVLDELSGVYPRKVLEQFYEEATAEKHSFLYINLLADRREDMFYKNSEYRLLP